jgi:hypothetical protein
MSVRQGARVQKYTINDKGIEKILSKNKLVDLTERRG